jgi:hypothetical protein
LFSTGAGIRRLPGEQRDNSRGAHLGMLIRHMPGFRHAGRDLDRIAQDVDVLHLRRLERDEIDVAPAVVRRDDSGGARRSRPRACGGRMFSTSARTGS